MDKSQNQAGVKRLAGHRSPMERLPRFPLLPRSCSNISGQKENSVCRKFVGFFRAGCEHPARKFTLWMEQSVHEKMCA